jgi:SAM-dependent methyltransferase
VDSLRLDPEATLQSWAARVRANRDQVDQFREASPSDFYAPVAGMFRADPRRTDDPTLEVLRSQVRPEDVVLDIGAGGGRYTLPLALATREVIALDPSEGMLNVLRSGLEEHHIDNVRVVADRWPATLEPVDVALISHLGYDVEDIGPFLDAMESVARRMCIAVLLDRPPPTEADRFWPLVHGVERAALPALPEFLTLLLARGCLFELRLVERAQQTYSEPEQALAWLRQQLWTRPGSDKDARLEAAFAERIQQHDGRYALTRELARVGVVTWSR